MDLALFGRVLHRFRVLIAVGIVVALGLAFLTVARVGFDGSTPRVELRKKPSYRVEATLLVTEPSFPWGSAAQPPSGDPTRLTALTNVYIGLANSDAVRELMSNKPGASGTIAATPSYAVLPRAYAGFSSPTQLPIIVLASVGKSRTIATATAWGWIHAFRDYIRRQQAGAGIAPSDRIIVQTLKSPGRAERVNGPSPTVPIVVILGVMLAVIGLAFLLENLRPRPHLEVAEADSQRGPVPVRRSA